MSPGDQLRLLLEYAPALREAGILTVEVQGIKATLAPHEFAPEVESDAESNEEQFDVLHDPATYGHTNADLVPGRKQRKR